MLEAQKRGDLLGVRINNAEDEDVDPWALPPSRARAEREISGPFPAQVQIVRSNLVYVEKNGLPSAMLNRLLRLAAFQNPEFYKAQAMRLPTFNKPRVIACGEDLANYIALPRGCIAEVVQLFESHRIKPVIRDERFAGHPIEVNFSGQLRPDATRRCGRDRRIRRRDSLRSYCIWKDRFSSVDDCPTESERSRTGPSAAIARSMAGTISDVPQPPGQVNRTNWRRQE